MALKHKGLEFDAVPWRFTEKAALAFANSSTVPVIEDGGTAVADSWNIAVYLDEAYPSRPALFEGRQAVSMSHFFHHWAFKAIHPPILRAILLDLFRHLHPKDQAYFRESREKRFGKTLEAIGADARAAILELRGALEPVRPVLVQHPFLGGHGPGYCDYILFGAFQWARVMSPARLLEPDDPVYAWRERMLDLFDGYARKARGYEVWA